MGIASINPATGEVVKTFQALSEAEIEKKLQLAERTFKAERTTPFAVRAKRMLKAAEILERDKEKLAHLMTLEMGKTYKSAVAEAMKCTTGCRWCTSSLRPRPTYRSCPSPASSGAQAFPCRAPESQPPSAFSWPARQTESSAPP